MTMAADLARDDQLPPTTSIWVALLLMKGGLTFFEAVLVTWLSKRADHVAEQVS